MNERDLLLSAARCWAKAGRHDQAGERYARAEAWQLAAEAYDRAGRFVAAEACWAKAGDTLRAARTCAEAGWTNRASQRYAEALTPSHEPRLLPEDRVEALLYLRRPTDAWTAADQAEGSGALVVLAQETAHRGRPDLVARAFSYEAWRKATPWNRTLPHPKARQPRQPGPALWPSLQFESIAGCEPQRSEISTSATAHWR